MPEIEMTQTAAYWPLHTTAEMDEAAELLFMGEPSLATEVHRSFDINGNRTVMLRVVGAGLIHIEAQLGTTLVRSAAGWEALNDAEAAARGIPVPATP